MKGIMAALIAAGILWAVDTKFNHGAYGQIVLRAARHLVGR
jgi:hypothetical protein